MHGSKSCGPDTDTNVDLLILIQSHSQTRDDPSIDSILTIANANAAFQKCGIVIVVVVISVRVRFNQRSVSISLILQIQTLHLIHTRNTYNLIAHSSISVFVQYTNEDNAHNVYRCDFKQFLMWSAFKSWHLLFLLFRKNEKKNSRNDWLIDCCVSERWYSINRDYGIFLFPCFFFFVTQNSEK